MGGNLSNVDYSILRFIENNPKINNNGSPIKLDYSSIEDHELKRQISRAYDYINSVQLHDNKAQDKLQEFKNLVIEICPKLVNIYRSLRLQEALPAAQLKGHSDMFNHPFYQTLFGIYYFAAGDNPTNHLDSEDGKLKIEEVKIVSGGGEVEVYDMISAVCLVLLVLIIVYIVVVGVLKHSHLLGAIVSVVVVAMISVLKENFHFGV